MSKILQRCENTAETALKNIYKTGAKAKSSLLRNKKVLKMNLNKVETACRLVYISAAGEVQIHPYLDLKRRDEVFGILCGNSVFCKTEEEPGTFQDAINNAKDINVGGLVACVPRDRNVREVLECQGDFNRTIEVLQEFGVVAHKWRDNGYWTLERAEKMKDISMICENILETRLMIKLDEH